MQLYTQRGLQLLIGHLCKLQPILGVNHISHLDVGKFCVTSFCGEQEEPFHTDVLLLELETYSEPKYLYAYSCKC